MLADNVVMGQPVQGIPLQQQGSQQLPQAVVSHLCSLHTSYINKGHVLGCHAFDIHPMDLDICFIAKHTPAPPKTFCHVRCSALDRESLDADSVAGLSRAIWLPFAYPSPAGARHWAQTNSFTFGLNCRAFHRLSRNAAAAGWR